MLFDSDIWDMPSRLFHQEDLFRGKDLPAVNIKETGDAFSVELSAPGYRKEDLKVNITDGILRIGSERREETKEEKDQYTRKEFHFSSFERQFQLPETADEDQVKAVYEDGILKLTIGKRKAASAKPARKVDIQ